ncbi:hypothetical protein BGW36DRAFT_361273 [Talaromyces proteolyticus]|uniref:Uncharacterized protein n=1 Tax=Talaromyces proteolyticus TaxID=1131652 RepID=A0AAD4KLR8_9EURO|nr:uncharacterized protein BGW36DRAFT_361273 [Talaromyces proteolyticus]KAH8695583.1 hypothetical protein BGW36DRAFT_361273 [Talaromyces proteolyticus]
MSGLINRVATGVGLVAEAHQHHKAKKAARQNASSTSIGLASSHDRNVPPNQDSVEAQDRSLTPAASEPAELEEEQWELDEAQDELVGGSAPRKSKNGAANPDKVVKAFLDRHPLLDSTAEDNSYHLAKLEYPVVLPQRRPRVKKRGFIRAYAPGLQNKGIDQVMWLDFIEVFNEASLANPWINAINLASLATNALPSAISFAVSTAIMIATQIAMETQGRYRQNTSLAKLNNEFFRPRGLYCLVMTWDPNSLSSRVNMGVNTTIKNSVSNQNKTMHNFHSSYGTTTQFEFMQTAELVFPGLDYIAAAPGEEAKGIKSKLKRSKLFVSEYMDRKAQAKFVGENPNNLLSNELNPTFASKFADPNHPIHSGDLVSLISLGYINPSRIRSIDGSRNGRSGGRLIESNLLGSRRGLAERIGGDAYYSQNSCQSDPGHVDSLSRRRGRGGGGLVGGLVGIAAEAVRNHGQQSNPRSPQDQEEIFRRESKLNDTQRQPVGGRRALERDGPLGINKLLKQKVLYLMVVNMPTEDEMSEARQITAEWESRDGPPPYEEVEM